MKMIKFLLFSIFIVLAMYKWRVYVPESWYAAGVGDIEDILRNYGYPLETHRVKTEDGYILTLHRIPRGHRKDTFNKILEKPPVFLMHGQVGCSIDWIVNGPGKSMALILADSGYDVWLGNNRGSTYSREHVSLNPDQDVTEFFNYSYHEIGIYDLPTMIDYILNTTGYKKLTYLGFSQGCTAFMVMNTLKPEYNEKILLMNAFAPVTNCYNVTNIVINFFAFRPYLLNAADRIGWQEWLSHSDSEFLRLMCNIKLFCDGWFYSMGASPEQIPDQEFLRHDILSNYPAGMSLKQVLHYAQGTRTGTFAQYDYGKEKNLKLYGRPDPPSYDLKKITVPIIIYFGEKDNVVNNDILLNSVAKELPNVVKIYAIPYSNFNHLDFIMGRDINLLTEEALRNINKYNNVN